MASSRNDKSRNYPANSTRNRLRRFLIESLENRLLLAADVDWSRSLSFTALEDLDEKQTTKANYAYHVNQQPQSMVVLSDRLALDLSPTAEADRSKLAPFGLQLRRELNSEFSVFTSQQPTGQGGGLVDTDPNLPEAW
jgi:hypothetical protein